jgi:hypothetical protein
MRYVKEAYHGRRDSMYESPSIVASFDADELLGEAFGGNPFCGNEGNGPNPGVGNGSCHSVV